MKPYIAIGPWTTDPHGAQVRYHITGLPPVFFDYGHFAVVDAHGWRISLDYKIVERAGINGTRGMEDCDKATEKFDILLLAETPNVASDISDDKRFFMAKLKDGREVRLFIDPDNDGGVLMEES